MKWWRACLFVGVVVQTGREFGQSAEMRIYSSVGGRAVLPCGYVQFSASCEGVNWARLGIFRVPESVVKSGKVVVPRKWSLDSHCSLLMDYLHVGDGGMYVCENSTGNTTVSLELLTISVMPNKTLAVNTQVSLDCYLSVFSGLVFCNHSGVTLTWVTEKGTELQGDRYNISRVSVCYTSLKVALRVTDHNRKWMCRLTERQEVKTRVSFVTALADDVEEVFAPMGQSLTLPCTNLASLSVGEELRWSWRETLLFSLTADGRISALARQSTEGLRMNPDASLSIGSVTAQLSGLYSCSKLNNSVRVSTHKMVTLHGLELSPDCVDNREANCSHLWTCSLSCGDPCEGFNFTWAGSFAGSQQAGAVEQINNTLLSKLILPEPLSIPDKIVCIVSSNGTERARQEWTSRSGIPVLPAVGFLLLALILLTCAAALPVYVKGRRKTHAGPVNNNIGMSPIYEECGEAVCSGHSLGSQRRSPETTRPEINTIYALQSAVLR